MTEEPLQPEHTAMVAYLLDQACQVAKDDAAAERPQETTIEQRVAIALVQARALEDRHISGMLLITGTAQQNRGLMALAIHLRERSHKLEQIGLQLAKEWPPVPGAGDKPWVELT